MSEPEARKIYELKQAEITRMKYGYDRARPKTIKLSKLINIYLDWVMRNRHYNTYRRSSLALTNFFNVVGDVNKVKREHFERFKLENAHRHPGGINTDIRSVKAMLNWAKSMEYIDTVPHISFMREKIKKVRILSDSEISQILATNIDRETLDTIEIYLLTGARARELLQKNFSWSDFNEQERFIVLGEGNKQHRVELSKRAMEILRSWKERSAPIPQGYTYIQKRFKKASTVCGVKFTAHDLRRAAGAILLRNGASIYEVSKFLGHSSVKVTERWYLDLLKEDYVKLSDQLEGGVKSLKNRGQIGKISEQKL